jgi:DNA-binding SARP family transcriptional activator
MSHRAEASAPATQASGMLEKPSGWLRGLFEECPFGLILTDGEGRVRTMNGRGVELILPDGGDPRGSRSCCELICGELNLQRNGGAGTTCLTDRALAARAALPEVRLDIHRGGVRKSVWVTASAVGGQDGQVVMYLRPADSNGNGDSAPHDAGTDRAGSGGINGLRIYTLGRTRAETAGAELGHAWLDQRPGQLLQYLVCNRHRLAASDQIAEALWPDTSPWSSNSLRHQVHVLRDRLEPNRPTGGQSSYVATHRGGYRLDARVWIDADEFEAQAQKGLAMFARGEEGSASSLLERALSLYKGDFFAESPYAEWALDERDRLRELAGRGLSALIHVRRVEGDLDAAAAYARRLAEMEPYDMDVQRDFLEICLKQGRRSAAIRRYSLLRTRMRREFGHGPDFALSDLNGRR